jgi:outer membrane protein assembly factor BamB
VRNLLFLTILLSASASFCQTPLLNGAFQEPSSGADTDKNSNRSVSSWTQWRGPDRTGIVTDARLAQLSSLEGLDQRWHVDLAESYSGPIIAEGKVFVTETKDKKTEVVRALDVATGKEIWAVEWPGSMSVPFFAKSNGDWIRATPIYDEGRLFVPGMLDVLVCLDAKDGKEIWRVDFAQALNSERPPFGNVPSPLIDGEFLYTQSGNALVKLNKKTGEIVWNSLPQAQDMMSGGAFSSPVLATIAGARQLVVQTRLELAGVDPENGNVLWKQEVPTFRGMNILTPVVVGDRVFTSTYQGGSFYFEISQTSGNWQVKELWKNRQQAYMSSPVIIDNHVYMHLRNQRVTCINLDTGKDVWVSEGFGKYWSMIAAGNRILALDETGKLYLLNANAEKFEILDQREVSKQSTWAHLGLCNDQIFVRELKGLSVFQFPTQK